MKEQKNSTLKDLLTTLCLILILLGCQKSDGEKTADHDSSALDKQARVSSTTREAENESITPSLRHFQKIEVQMIDTEKKITPENIAQSTSPEQLSALRYTTMQQILGNLTALKNREQKVTAEWKLRAYILPFVDNLHFIRMREKQIGSSLTFEQSLEGDLESTVSNMQREFDDYPEYAREFEQILLKYNLLTTGELSAQIQNWAF